MNLKKFNPTSVEALVKILDTQRVLIYANGTALAQKYKKSFPKPLAYLDGIKELRAIENLNNDNLSLGAMLEIKDLITCEKIPAPMKEVLALKTDDKSSLGGLVFNNHKMSNFVMLLYAYNAYFNLVSLDTDRYVPVNEFYMDNNNLNISSNEFLKRIILPMPKLTEYFYYWNDNFSVFILYKLFNNRISDIRISFLFDKVIRSKYVENMIISCDYNDLQSKMDEIISLYIQEISYYFKKDLNFNHLEVSDTIKKYLNSIF